MSDSSVDFPNVLQRHSCSDYEMVFSWDAGSVPDLASAGLSTKCLRVLVLALAGWVAGPCFSWTLQNFKLCSY